MNANVSSERLRSHADDRARPAVDHDVPANHRPVPAKPFLPRRVSEDDYRADPSSNDIVGHEEPAERRLHVEQREIVSSDPRDEHAVRIGGLRRERQKADIVTGDVIEEVGGDGSIRGQVWCRHSPQGLAGQTLSREDNEPGAVSNWERTQQDLRSVR